MDFFDNIIDQIRDHKTGGHEAPVTWYGIPENLRNAVDVPGMEPPKEDKDVSAGMASAGAAAPGSKPSSGSE